MKRLIDTFRGFGRKTPKCSVMRKIPIAMKLPTAEIFGANGRAAIISPAIISTVPISIEAACTLITLYIQDISGELATKP
jgi:hypothetical protein